MLLQEAAPQPQPKLEKQGSGLKKGLKKVKNGVRNMTDRVKDRTTRRLNKTPGPVSTPAAPPAQGSTSSGSELQRGGSLKDKLKKKFNRSRRGEIFVHIDLASSLLHRSRHMTTIHCSVWCDSKM
jgi:hypothetical protein